MYGVLQRCGKILRVLYPQYPELPDDPHRGSKYTKWYIPEPSIIERGALNLDDPQVRSRDVQPVNA